jgi:tight adherence protein B
MILPVLASFVVCVGAIYGAYWFFVVRPEQQALGIVRKRLKPTLQRKKSAAVGLSKEVVAFSSVGALDAALRRGAARLKPLELLVEQSGTRLTVGRLLLSSAVAGMLVILLVHRLTGMLLPALGAGVVAMWMPFSVLRFLRTRRMLKFEEMLPEALDLLSRVMRAGHAFTTGIQMVADELPDPIGPEFRLLYDQQNYGMPMPDALRVFATRIPVLDARFFVTAVLIQRESGGNLSEVLDNLAGVIRERFKVKRQVRVISAHGRITGWILAALPPCLGMALMVISPEHRQLMLHHPVGQQMVMIALGMQVVGTLAIRKIVNIEY